MHDFALAAIGGGRQTPADDLAQAGQIGLDPIMGLRPAGTDAKTGNHLVEYEHDILFIGDLPQSLQKACARQDSAHISGDWFDDNGGDLAAIIAGGRAHGIGVVVGHGQGAIGDALGNAWTVGGPQRQSRRSGLNQETIAMPVPAALEFDNLIPSRVAPCQTHRRHRRLGARIDHPHHLHRGHHRGDARGQIGFDPGRGTKAGAPSTGFLHRRDHPRMGVAEDEWPPGTDVVNILLAVDIIESGTSTPVDEARPSTHGAKGPSRTIDPTGY